MIILNSTAILKITSQLKRQNTKIILEERLTLPITKWCCKTHKWGF